MTSQAPKTRPKSGKTKLLKTLYRCLELNSASHIAFTPGTREEAEKEFGFALDNYIEDYIAYRESMLEEE